MTLINKMTQLRQGQFETARVQGTGHLAPRNGHYVFKSFYYRQIGHTTVLIGRCMWKPNNNSIFIKDLEFEVAMRTFLDSKSTSKIESEYELPGKLIAVHGLKLEYNKDMPDGKPTISLSWSHIQKKPEIASTTFEMLKPKPKTVTDIVMQWRNSLGSYQVEELIEQEAERLNEAQETYVEEPSEMPDLTGYPADESNYTEVEE